MASDEIKPLRFKHRRVNLRKSHPALFHSIMTVGVMGVALALNFWTSTPTFNPYDIPKNLIGLVFFIIGISQILFLTVFRDLRLVRIALAISIGFMGWWGASNLQQFFAGESSAQLPILYLAVMALQYPLLVEAPVNPMTEKK